MTGQQNSPKSVSYQNQQQQGRIDVEQLDVEEAETANLASFEPRNNNNGGAPRFLSTDTVVDRTNRTNKLANVARNISIMRQASLSQRQLQLAQKFQQLQKQKTKNVGNQKANSILGTIQQEKPESQKGFLQTALRTTVDDDDSDTESEANDDTTTAATGETLPLRSHDYGSISTETNSHVAHKKKKPVTGAWLCCFRGRRHRRSADQKPCWQQAFHCFYRRFLCSFFVLLGIPLFISAWILFYYCADPAVPKLNPNGSKVTVSWLLNFLGRQIVVLEASRIIQYILLDWILISCKIAERLFGPYVTLVVIQAHGFPFILIVWASLDMVVLRGLNDFQDHWFYWTGLEIYSDADAGSELLYSAMYLRILLSTILIGIATVVKRTVMSLRFGKRLMAQFKPRMEKLLADIVLMNELAILADQVETVTAAFIGSTDSHEDIQILKAATLSKAADSVEAGVDIMKEKVSWITTGVDDDNVAFERDDGAPIGESTENTDYNASRNNFFDQMKKNSSGEFMIKDLLDPWDDPVESINNKNREATIDDVLKFQRALGYMDETHPFGYAFGPTSNRDEAIGSYHEVYRKLAKFDGHDNKMVNFNVIALIANDSIGVPIPTKLHAVRKLFRPDARNELPLLAFVQSCDAVYKRLRYFRASVNNSSAIDKVLQDMINGIYWFIMIFLVLELLDLDPWTLLVSITSLLVSVSFAMGSSVSNYIEGLLLIAMRRPYDLGDRIMIVGSETQDKPLPNESFFVEDITLLTTTVRFAKTNEVSTINNFSISKSRIINLQRSANACLDFELKFKDTVLQTGDHLKFREMLEQYIRDHPRIWDRLLFMRHDEIDPDWGHVTFRFSLRHCNSWQNSGRIMLHRADLVRFMYDKGMELQIHWETPISRRTILDGGIIENDVIRPRRPGIDFPLFASTLLTAAATDP